MSKERELTPEELILHGRVDLLRYLIGVAQKTEGAEVWRALFAEMLKDVKFCLGARKPKRVKL